VFDVVPGLAGQGTVSFRSVNFPDRYLRHAGYVMWLHPNDRSGLFANDASFFVRDGLKGAGSVSFESINFRNFYVRHAGHRVMISANDNSDLFRSDASWFSRDMSSFPNTGEPISKPVV